MDFQPPVNRLLLNDKVQRQEKMRAAANHRLVRQATAGESRDRLRVFSRIPSMGNSLVSRSLDGVSALREAVSSALRVLRHTDCEPC